MTDVLCIDYATARPSPAAVKAAGYGAVLRYLSHNSAPGKDLTAAEAATLLDAGLGIGCVWETTGDRALAGAAAGESDGALAVAQAKAVGLPSGCLLLVNLGDFVATASQIPVIASYYSSFRHVPGFEYEAGGYATAYIIEQLAAGGATGFWWQNAMDDDGVPGAVVSARASMYQRVAPTKTIAGAAAGSFDEDICGFGPAAPVWWRKAAPAPAPAPVAVQDGYLVTGTYAGRAVKSSDGGKTWS